MHRRVKMDTVRLAATGIYLAICWDSRFSVLKTNTGVKKRVRGNGVIAFYGIDIDKVIQTLVNHNLLPPDAVDDYETFFLVRNGYVGLRKRRIRSLEKLVSSIIKSRTVIEEFCREFPAEAKSLLLINDSRLNEKVV